MNSGRTYALGRRLSHADVDFLGELKVSALLGLLEQAAVEASTAGGYDAARYTREARVWIIRRTHLRRLVPVGGVDEIEVRTQVADFRRARSLRRYEVRRGEVLAAEAVSDWVYCDMAGGRPTRIPPELQAALYGPEPPTLPREASIESALPGEAGELRVRVRPSHLDHVRHVNNAIYTSFLEDAAFDRFAADGWPLARMLEAGGALRLDELDAEYLKDAADGDELLLRTWLLEPPALGGDPPSSARLHQLVSRRDGTEILRARSRWSWRRAPAVLGGVPAAENARTTAAPS